MRSEPTICTNPARLATRKIDFVNSAQHQMPFGIRPRRARRRILVACNTSDILKLTTFLFGVSWFQLTHFPLVTLVAQLASSNKDKDQPRDAKDDSYAKRLIMNWEIIRRSGRKERYQRQARAVEGSM